MTEKPTVEAIYKDNERQANIYSARCLSVLGVIVALVWALNIVGVFTIPADVLTISMPVGLFCFFAPLVIVRLTHGEGAWVKIVIMLMSVIGVAILNMAMPSHTVLSWIIPVLISCHYYSKPLTGAVLTVSLLFFSAAMLGSLYYGEWDNNMMAALDPGGPRVVTPRILQRVALLYIFPNCLLLIGVANIGLTLSGRTRGMLLRQQKDAEERQRIEAEKHRFEVEHERIATELNLATNIQAHMLPCIFPPFPDRKEFDLYASMDPAKEVGGDFYDFFFIDDDHLALEIADVSGKGVPAALFMMASKSLLQTRAKMGGTPADILAFVNNQLCSNNEAGMFVTVWLGILEISTGKLIAANAGHEFPTIRRGGGAYELFRDKHGFVLGGMDGMRYRNYELTLCPGDSLYVYTDGVAEANNRDGELFGTERMLNALNVQPDAQPKKILENVRAGIDAFVQEAAQFDDITMLSLQYHGTEKAGE